MKNSVSFSAGDFILGHKSNIHDRIIHLATRSPWNHAGLVINSKGEIIEIVEGKGIQKSRLSLEQEDEILLVKTELTKPQQDLVVKYAKDTLRRKEKFGFISLFSVLLNSLFKTNLIFKTNGRMTCSEFVANALEHGGVIFPKDPALITPSHLAKQFHRHFLISSNGLDIQNLHYAHSNFV